MHKKKEPFPAKKKSKSNQLIEFYRFTGSEANMTHTVAWPRKRVLIMKYVVHEDVYINVNMFIMTANVCRNHIIN